MPVVGEYVRGYWSRTTESSIHALRMFRTIVLNRVMRELEKNGDTWYRMLGHCYAKNIVEPREYSRDSRTGDILYILMAI
jgi:hypothetical protein